jgi:transcriptional regulator with XRE-family HTH domain
MSGLYTTILRGTKPDTLGEQLRALRRAAGRPGWEVAAAAKMDSTKLSKIETGKRLPTEQQLAALAKFFNAPLAPLERRRLAEELMKSYGDHPEFDAAADIVREEIGEHRVKKMPAAVSKRPKTVNKSEKSVQPSGGFASAACLRLRKPVQT